MISSYLSVLKHIFKKKVTLKYPEEKNKRSIFRGKHTLNTSRCTRCKTCERSCINDAIKIDRDFEIDYRLCCFCGRCTAACPTKALSMLTDDVDGTTSSEELIAHLNKENI